MNLQKDRVFKKVYDSDTRRFEARLSDFFESANVLTVCNATTGIMGVLYALGITDGEIITTPLTWGGALSGPIMLNDDVVFSDLEKPSLNINPDTLERLITPDTKCVLSSDFLGTPARLDRLQHICHQHNLLLIHDAATSFGSYYKGHYSGYYADVCIHSFGRNKAFSTGEGGCISTHDNSLFEKILESMAHPERQVFQRENCNLFAMNTTMHPLAIEYGLKTFDDQMERVYEHRDMVIEKMKNNGCNDFLDDSFLPNFYMPYYGPKAKGKLSSRWRSLPYQLLFGQDEELEEYQVATDLCLYN